MTSVNEDYIFELAKYDLYTFVATFWKYAGTRDAFKPNWFVEAICDHLQALADLELRNLAISIAPRHGKSTIVSVLFPVWRWLTQPKDQFLTATNVSRLATRDALKSRRLIETSLFQAAYGHLFQLTSDQNQKTRYDNNYGGYRYTTSIDSTVTGEGSDILIIDDPHNAKDGSSAAKMENVIDWYTGTISSRYNNPSTFCKLLIHQRIGENDLIGYVRRNEYDEWEHLILEEEYTGRQYTTCIGFTDPRTKIGELLAPNLFSEEDAEKKKKDRVVWETQYQQNPTPKESAIIKDSYIKYYSHYLDLTKLKVIISIDTKGVGEHEKNSHHSSLVWGVAGNNKYLIDNKTKNCNFTEEVKVVRELIKNYKPDHIIIEKKANGKALFDVLNEDRNNTPKLILFNPNSYGDKETRLMGILNEFENGYIHLPLHENFTNQYLEELLKFPKSIRDDQVDSTTQFLIWNRQNTLNSKSYEVVESRDNIINMITSPKIDTLNLFEVSNELSDFKEIRELF